MRILNLKMGDRGINIFSELCPSLPLTSPLHAHPYSEIQVILDGKVRYNVEDTPYALATGDVIQIPAGQLHTTAGDEGSRVFVFQTELSTTSAARLSLPPSMLAPLAASDGENLDAVLPILFYLLALLSPQGLCTVRQNDDYAYLIHEYIEQNYHRPVRLCELAERLHLSERQTQRIIQRLFGMGFSALLAGHRASVAARLASTTDMPWCEIAAYVGYDTYSGFRRSFRRHSATE